MDENTTTRSKGLILVVDDSEDIRSLLGQIFEEEGYRLIFAGDGESALELAKLHHPSLILMDMSLPGMTGWEAVEHLRQMDEFRCTLIVALTAYASLEDEERALAVGCTAHVSKPFDINNLLESINSLMPN